RQRVRARLGRGRRRRRDRSVSGRRAGHLPARHALRRPRRRRARRRPPGRRGVVSTSLLSVWLHLLGVVAWIGGLLYQAHVLGPAAPRGGAAPGVAQLRRARPGAWGALAPVLAAGFFKLTPLRPFGPGV